MLKLHIKEDVLLKFFINGKPDVYYYISDDRDIL